MRGSIAVAPSAKDGPFDVMFYPDGKDGAVPKYTVKDFAELERALGSFRIKLTEEQVEKLETEGINIPDLNPSDEILKEYGLI
jgi:hypothetical protein